MASEACGKDLDGPYFKRRQFQLLKFCAKQPLLEILSSTTQARNVGFMTVALVSYQVSSLNIMIIMKIVVFTIFRLEHNKDVVVSTVLADRKSVV